ncbi:MAG TPA: glycosyltransferase family 87 protein [Acidobacteriaceae bacterium]|nr:glycosyltransferase family 87 protein [Acidobacteriaceae bacterium]
MEAPLQRKKFDPSELILGVACALGLVSTAIILMLMPVNRHFASSRDFVVYWASGQQLVHHGNPFDPQQMAETERAGGFDRPGAFYMRNPPWSLPLTLPLGLASAQVEALPWSLLLIGLLVLSVRITWQMFGRSGTHLEWLGYCFPPALQCVLMGQTSLFLLLGLVLFLWWHRTRPFWAGAALWLCTLKPHLFVPFGVVLLVWILVGRQWRILLGALTALAASCLVITLVDPAVWAQYAHWAAISGISHEPIPCLGVALRNLVNPAAEWLVFIPCALGSLWALVYFWPRRHAWNWREHGHLVVLVSLAAAPYCWVLDQSVALPALLFAAVSTRSRAALAVLGVIYLLLELQPMLFSPGLNSAWYLWPAPVWIAWYLWARRSSSISHSAPLPVAAPAS